MIYDDATKTLGHLVEFERLDTISVILFKDVIIAHIRSDQRSDMYLSMRALYKGCAGHWFSLSKINMPDLILPFGCFH